MTAVCFHTKIFLGQRYCRYHQRWKRCVCNCEDNLGEEFAFPGGICSERQHYIFGYLSNASWNIGPGRYPLAPTESMFSFWQIWRLQDQSSKAVYLTADILLGIPGIWNQVQDGKYSMVLVSPEVLLRNGSFFWKVVATDKKCTFLKCLGAVVINKCHQVWGWSKFRNDSLSLEAMYAHFQHLAFFALSTMIIPNVSKFVINSLVLPPGLHLYKAAIDGQNITPMVPQIDPAQGYVQISPLIPITGVAWQIPNSMIIVDTINKCICISTNLCDGVSFAVAEYHRMVVTPFHASLGVSLQEQYLNTFRDGETRDHVCTGTYHIIRDHGNIGTQELCTDAPGIGVDITDIEVVM